MPANLRGMSNSDERLHTFMRIYEAEFGERLSESEAKLIADRLMYLFERLTRALPGERETHRPNSEDTGEVSVISQA